MVIETNERSPSMKVRKVLKFLEHCAEFFEDDDSTAEPTPSPYSEDTTVPLSQEVKNPIAGIRLPSTPPKTCEHCTHFSWETGQAAMQQHAPFLQVMNVVQPWQLAQERREWEPTPEYVELRNRCEAILAAMGDFPISETRLLELETELQEHQQAMEMMSPQQISAPSKQTTPEMLRTQWKDFGACTLHGEGRAKQDHCERWEADGRRHLGIASTS